MPEIKKLFLINFFIFLRPFGSQKFSKPANVFFCSAPVVRCFLARSGARDFFWGGG
ncbi:MAG: hypothetical protein H7A08_02240 [Oceanospirillaceae bacterium]|nr:hypothetical protein [Oceanospirillaceae bacterium]